LLASFYLPLKKAFMPDLTQSGSADAKFDCNILSRKALDPYQQQLMAEAPDISSRTNLERIPLITTDGFAFYVKKVIRRVFGPACLYGQVIKTRRNDRIVKVERRAIIGADWRLDKMLADSEDSSKLNTSFIERLNLTIRQGSAYLSRRTICHARWKERLEDHLELIRCYYNFVRPHRALKFGREVRTPAMQAGLTTRRLTFRAIFSSTMSFFGAAKYQTFVLRLDHVGQCRR
jgi:IS1 family transposase